MPLVLVALLAVFAAQAGATNLIQNGNFQSGDFTDWTIGTTSGGTWGQGFPIVTGWPLGGMNAAEGEVGNVNPTGTQQGGTLTQTFTSGAGAATLSLLYAAMGDGTHTNADGGDFTMILDGVTLNSVDVGQITADQIINGTLSANVNLTAGSHTLEIDVTRLYLTEFQGTPYQYVTGVDVEGTVPEPGSLILMGSGVLGLAGVLRRKIGF
jgi:hypothetical protein